MPVPQTEALPLLISPCLQNPTYTSLLQEVNLTLRPGGRLFSGLPHSYASALGALAMEYWCHLGQISSPPPNQAATWGQGLGRSSLMSQG